MSNEAFAAWAQAFTGAGVMLVALVAYWHSRRTFQLQSINLYISNWRDISRTFLQSERARDALAKLSPKAESQAEDVTLVIFIYINQALLAYYAWRFGALPKNELTEEFRSIWQVLANSLEKTKVLLHSESYPPRFVAMFEEAGALLRK
jgi:hypothetical protein